MKLSDKACKSAKPKEKSRMLRRRDISGLDEFILKEAFSWLIDREKRPELVENDDLNFIVGIWNFLQWKQRKILSQKTKDDLDSDPGSELEYAVAQKLAQFLGLTPSSRGGAYLASCSFSRC